MFCFQTRRYYNEKNGLSPNSLHYRNLTFAVILKYSLLIINVHLFYYYSACLVLAIIYLRMLSSTLKSCAKEIFPVSFISVTMLKLFSCLIHFSCLIFCGCSLIILLISVWVCLFIICLTYWAYLHCLML